MKILTNFAGILTLLGMASSSFSHMALAGEPIYVQPGQCVMVGSQQVCAMKGDATVAPGEVTYACRNSEHKGGDLPGYKTYGLVKVVGKPDGSLSEVLIKDFGMKGKEKCDEAAADRKKQ